MFSLEIRTRPDQIPTHIDVDISELKVGSSIRIQDLTLPKGVEPSGDHSLTVVTTRAVVLPLPPSRRSAPSQ